jgi:hypothetical protein
MRITVLLWYVARTDDPCRKAPNFTNMFVVVRYRALESTRTASECMRES